MQSGTRTEAGGIHSNTSFWSLFYILNDLFEALALYASKASEQADDKW